MSLHGTFNVVPSGLFCSNTLPGIACCSAAFAYVCVIVRILPACVILYLPVVVSVSWRKPVGTRASAEEVQGVTSEV